jgi:uncharacterized protein
MTPRSGTVALAAASILLISCAHAASDPLLDPAFSSEPREEAIDLVTEGGTIHGTLLLPAARTPVPVALIIAGSGPTDRDGNSPLLPGQNNSLRLLAEGLAEQGIASVRYDKRGIAASTPAATSEAELRFDTYVDDAAAWVRMLSSDPRFSGVTLVGHSEGSLIGMRAAQLAPAAAYVSLAGISRPASDVLRDQLRPQLPPDLWAESERVLTRLEAGQLVDSVAPVLVSLYRPSVQPYLISWFAYRPAEEIARLSVPVLIAQGTTDIQVGVAEAHALHAARPDAELLIVEGMNHVLKEVPADLVRQQASYGDPHLPVVSELIDRIGAFIHRAAARRLAV